MANIVTAASEAGGHCSASAYAEGIETDDGYSRFGGRQTLCYWQAEERCCFANGPGAA
jgi:hypothetical protein